MYDKLKWTSHGKYVEGRLKPRLYFLKNSFQIDSRILSLFYISIIFSVWTYSLSCCGGNCDKTNYNVIDPVVRKASRVVGEELPGLDAVYIRRVRAKLRALWNDQNLLHEELASTLIPRSGRLRPLKAHTCRHADSFIGRATSIHNADYRS